MLPRAACLVTLASMLALVAPADGATCPNLSVLVDSSLADGALGTTIIGRAIGQTFVAPTKWIESLTVWRTYQQDSLDFGIHLFVCKLDSTGVPLTAQPLYDGPTITAPFGDGIHS